MNDINCYRSLLQCPECGTSPIELSEHSALICHGCETAFPLIEGRPILLRQTNELFKVNDYFQNMKVSKRNKSSLSHLKRLLLSPSVNLSCKRVLLRMSHMLRSSGKRVVLVLGSGEQRIWLDELLEAGDDICVIYSDIDINADMDLVCDGHTLPFVDGAFDAVITTAVLEHVLYPETVAKEIHRILKVGGLLYSELPFMQQVHEGAYDFTRYTLSGHRRLFNRIEEIESGMVAGPGTALAWSIENFALSLASRRTSRFIVKIISRLFFSWFKYFDYFLKNSPQAMDSASCTYIFGRRSSIKVTDKEIVDSYIGAKHLSHT